MPQKKTQAGASSCTSTVSHSQKSL